MMLKNQHQQQLNMEITVISAQGLKNTSVLFSRRLRPFITLTTVAAADKGSHVYKTRVDDEGGVDPTWGDKFHLPVDSTFFYQKHSCIYLQLYTKRLMVGHAQLGWCRIPAADIVDGFLPPGTLRRLSYRLRDRDGSRGHGVVNIAVKLEGSLPVVNPPQRPLTSNNMAQLPCQTTVIGIPVRMLPPGSDCQFVCRGQNFAGGAKWAASGPC